MMNAAVCNCRKNMNFVFRRQKLIQNSFRNKTDISTSPANYCVDLVRKFDYENFLCTLLLTSESRSLAFAVRAFNVEVAKVQDQVSQEQIAQMRLKFWLETVENLFKDQNIKDKKLSKNHLKSLVQSRMTPVSSSTFKNLEDMEKYAENSVSPVYYLILQGSGYGSVHTDHAASHLGKSQGLVNILRSIPYNLGRRTVTLPQDLLLKHNLPQEKILRGKNDSNLKEVIFEIASRAKQHLEKARSLKKSCPKEASTLFLPAVCINAYLERLRKIDFDIFNEKLRKRNNVLHIQLYWNKLLSKY
ncbi:NADH dehydrogenase (ubiquinone) complex I, assembly factor 6 homolog sicily isoform X2 [Lycorma delicatula]|uniref:NADH dehydrogenase (ubiquinone) complex I, assembly factor 6 homolog sicily isoform X2 n=1 Tax=Lycorma delicatula TaxID=130591 RepID=UPI003F518ABF